MYWRFGIQQYLTIDRVLDKDDVTLEEVLNDSGLLNQMKSKNQKLLNFIVRPRILKRLIDYVSGDLFFESPRYGQLACEMLSLDSPMIMDALMDTYTPLELGEEEENDDDDEEKQPNDDEDDDEASKNDNPDDNDGDGDKKSGSRSKPSNKGESNIKRSSRGQRGSVDSMDSVDSNSSFNTAETSPSSDEEEYMEGSDDSKDKPLADKKSSTPDYTTSESSTKGIKVEANNIGKSSPMAIIDEPTSIQTNIETTMALAPVKESWEKRMPLFFRLWRLVYTEPDKINQIQATCFSRLMCVLMQMKQTQAIPFIKANPQVVTRLLAHINNSPMTDVLLKLVSMEEFEESQGIVDWLNGEGLIDSLVDMLDPSVDVDTHTSASQVLLDIISISQCTNPDQPTIGTNVLIDELKSARVVKKLVGYMLDPREKNGVSSLINGTYVFIELIRRNYNSDWDIDPFSGQPDSSSLSEFESHGFTVGNVSVANQFGDVMSGGQPQMSVDLSEMMQVLADNVHAFVALLSRPRTSIEPHDTPTGKQVPIGFERLRICELLAEILHCSNMRRLNQTKEEVELETARLKKLHEQNNGSGSGAGGDISEAEDKKDESKDNNVNNDSSKSGQEAKYSNATTSGSENNKPTDDEFGTQAAAAVTTSNKDTEMSTHQSTVKDNEKLSVSSLPVGQQLKYRLVETEALISCLQLFFDHPWNNFIHSVIYDMMHQTLNLQLSIKANYALVRSVFVDGQLTKKIIAANSANTEACKKPKGTRLGYMGHLNGITDEVVRLTELAGSELTQDILDFVKEKDWTEYIENVAKIAREEAQGSLGAERTTSDIAIGGDDGSGNDGEYSIGDGGSGSIIVSATGEEEDGDGNTANILQEEDYIEEDGGEDGTSGSTTGGDSNRGKREGIVAGLGVSRKVYRVGSANSEDSDDEDLNLVNTEDMRMIEREDGDEDEEEILGAPLHRHNSIMEDVDHMDDDDDEDDDDDDEDDFDDEQLFNATLGVRDDDIYRKNEDPSVHMLRFVTRQDHQFEQNNTKRGSDNDVSSSSGEGGNDSKMLIPPVDSEEGYEVDSAGKDHDGSKNNNSSSSNSHLQPVLYDDIDVDDGDATELGWMNDYMRARITERIQSSLSETQFSQVLPSHQPPPPPSYSVGYSSSFAHDQKSSKDKYSDDHNNHDDNENNNDQGNSRKDDSGGDNKESKSETKAIPGFIIGEISKDNSNDASSSDASSSYQHFSLSSSSSSATSSSHHGGGFVSIPERVEQLNLHRLNLDDGQRSSSPLQQYQYQYSQGSGSDSKGSSSYSSHHSSNSHLIPGDTSINTVKEIVPIDSDAIGDEDDSFDGLEEPINSNFQGDYDNDISNSRSNNGGEGYSQYEQQPQHYWQKQMQQQSLGIRPRSQSASIIEKATAATGGPVSSRPNQSEAQQASPVSSSAAAAAAGAAATTTTTTSSVGGGGPSSIITKNSWNLRRGNFSSGGRGSASIASSSNTATGSMSKGNNNSSSGNSSDQQQQQQPIRILDAMPIDSDSSDVDSASPDTLSPFSDDSPLVKTTSTGMPGNEGSNCSGEASSSQQCPPPHYAIDKHLSNSSMTTDISRSFGSSGNDDYYYQHKNSMTSSSPSSSSKPPPTMSAAATKRPRSRSQSAGVGISRSMVLAAAAAAASSGGISLIDPATDKFVGRLKNDNSHHNSAMSSGNGGAGGGKQLPKSSLYRMPSHSNGGGSSGLMSIRQHGGGANKSGNGGGSGCGPGMVGSSYRSVSAPGGSTATTPSVVASGIGLTNSGSNNNSNNSTKSTTSGNNSSNNPHHYNSRMAPQPTPTSSNLFMSAENIDKITKELASQKSPEADKELDYVAPQAFPNLNPDDDNDNDAAGNTTTSTTSTAACGGSDNKEQKQADISNENSAKPPPSTFPMAKLEEDDSSDKDLVIVEKGDGQDEDLVLVESSSTPPPESSTSATSSSGLLSRSSSSGSGRSKKSGGGGKSSNGRSKKKKGNKIVAGGSSSSGGRSKRNGGGGNRKSKSRRFASTTLFGK
ncbi:sporulation-induced protein [Mycoemilia scoparia]|uniref:Sporulation-induced protein n=1 Tax=Mycoemilia scoparia TaxID=417184 RepID=A0A9W8DME9_9FUNG|nr:sporulation-induced protein [Mycoemilia scoparia]